MPQLVPSTTWTKREKHTSTAKATHHGCELSAKPKPKRKIAAKKREKNCAQARPWNPMYLKTSLVTPPKDLTKVHKTKCP